MKFSPLGRMGVVCRDQAKARACNIDLSRLRVNMLQGEQSNRAKEAKLKRPIIDDQIEIDIMIEHCKGLVDVHLSFYEIEDDPHPYPSI